MDQEEGDLLDRGTSLNNQITFLNPLTEGNKENEESTVVVFRLIRALLFDRRHELLFLRYVMSLIH